MNCSQSYQTFSDGKNELRYGHLCGFLEAEIVHLSPIKNPALFVSQEFSLLTAAIRILEKY